MSTSSSQRTSDGSQLLRSLVVVTACLFFIYFIFYRLDDPESLKVLLANSTLGNSQVTMQDSQQESGGEGPSADTIIFATQTAKKEDDGQDNSQGGSQDPGLQDTVTQSNQNNADNNVMQNTNPDGGQRVEDGKTFFSTQTLFGDEGNNQTNNNQSNNNQSNNNQINNQESTQEEIIPLSGTFLREGELRSLRDFGLLGQEEYIQKTVYNSHFGFLGDFAGNLLEGTQGELTDAQRRALIPGIEEMGGNIVAITDKIAIQENGLYGDRVWFLNTERYEQLNKVVYIVFFDQADDVWFVQMDRERYYDTKSLIRNIFDDWYDW